MTEPLDGAHVLITGATGFVGQAVLERLLSGYPTTRMTLLVRARGEISGAERIRRLTRKPVFASWRESVGAEGVEQALAERVAVVEGDLGSVPDLPGDLDVVVHSASTVSFDLPIDEAFASNVAGPVALYDAIAASGSDPHVVHVSTSYVAGLRKGVSEETSLEHDVDWRAELDASRVARTRADHASRDADRLAEVLKRATREHGRAGAQAVSAAAEEAREDSVRDELVAAGRNRALTLGWPDVYTFTKALGERVAETRWGAEHRLSVVRPTIIESAFRHPYPGWIDGFKVADPLIAAYGRGLLPEFPALADTVLDVIPVDFVVGAILAAAAAPPERGAPAYYQVGSGLTNPLRFGRLYSLVREYFQDHPLSDAEGEQVTVPTWSFPHGRAVERGLGRRERLVQLADRAVSALPGSPRSRSWSSTLYKAGRDLRTLRKFTELYQPYTQTEVIFDDRRTRELHHSLPEERRAEHGFDVAAIDWQVYLQEVHIPNVPGLMRERRAASQGVRPTAGADLARREDVVAVFDLQRTIARSTPVEHLLWAELTAKSPGSWPRSVLEVVSKAPGFLTADRHDRGEFIRSVMRRYEGVPDARMRALVQERLAPSLRANLHSEALARIAEHRAAGHRTVLVTGEIDVFVEPLHDLFDHIVAGRMEVDDDGRWTGHLEVSPLVGETRAAWLHRTAREHGWDLSGSFAYGDAYADRPWLEVVGNPTAVNPDAALYAFARARRWPVVSWTGTAESRLAPVWRAVRGTRS
ncbi:HAD-IB family phosphatase [Georgenia sp. Z1491]|uniref:HAD-IB family phosphatase n=1 Tax=Georgenia sp. Z1491 TaxID=3416707 RepID=UPI003CF0E9A2